MILFHAYSPKKFSTISNVFSLFLTLRSSHELWIYGSVNTVFGAALEVYGAKTYTNLYIWRTTRFGKLHLGGVCCVQAEEHCVGRGGANRAFSVNGVSFEVDIVKVASV